MNEPVDVPRPAAADRASVPERLRALRGDPRAAAVVLACVAIAAGVAWFRAGVTPAAPPGAPERAAAASSPKGGGGSASPSSTTAAAVSSTTTGHLVVDVVGAVRRPGVVSLPAGARVLDAVRAAGGPVAGADTTRLNLAAPIGDGARVAVPLAGQSPPAVDPSAVTGAGGASTVGGDGVAAGGSGSAAGPVNVNTATSAQLETLPGIGPSLAAAIVQERERNGPFGSAEDLGRVAGIGPGRLARLHGLVSV